MNRLVKSISAVIISASLLAVSVAPTAFADDGRASHEEQRLDPADRASSTLPPASAAFAPGEIAMPAAGYGYNLSYRLYPSTPWKWSSGNRVFSFIKPKLKSLFPIGGMVNNPRVGQKLILTGKNPVRVTEVGSRHFKLYSLPGHLEGAGNTIVFTISANGQSLNFRTWGPKPAKFPGNIVPYVVWPKFGNSIKYALYPTGISTPH